MDISHQELRERYQNASTDELLHIKISSELTEIAKLLLQEELSRRDVKQGDIEYAEQVEAVLKADRDSIKRRIRRRVQRIAIIIVLIILMAIYFEFLQ